MAIHLLSIDTIAQLKMTTDHLDQVVLTLGQSTKGDGKGAFFYFDPADTTTPEDSTYYNTVIPTELPGRWKKVFTRMQQLPHGTLVMNAGKKEFFALATTNSNGEVVVNLTMENTANGTAIFKEIWFNACQAVVAASEANEVVIGGVKIISADKKVSTYKFVRGGASPLSLSVVTQGLTIKAFQNAAAGSSVLIKVEGI